MPTGLPSSRARRPSSRDRVSAPWTGRFHTGGIAGPLGQIVCRGLDRLAVGLREEEILHGDGRGARASCGARGCGANPDRVSPQADGCRDHPVEQSRGISSRSTEGWVGDRFAIAAEPPALHLAPSGTVPHLAGPDASALKNAVHDRGSGPEPKAERARSEVHSQARASDASCRSASGWLRADFGRDGILARAESPCCARAPGRHVSERHSPLCFWPGPAPWRAPLALCAEVDRLAGSAICWDRTRPTGRSATWAATSPR